MTTITTERSVSFMDADATQLAPPAAAAPAVDFTAYSQPTEPAWDDTPTETIPRRVLPGAAAVAAGLLLAALALLAGIQIGAHRVSTAAPAPVTATAQPQPLSLTERVQYEHDAYLQELDQEGVPYGNPEIAWVQAKAFCDHLQYAGGQDTAADYAWWKERYPELTGTQLGSMDGIAVRRVCPRFVVHADSH